jgi:hypothetical protein
MPRTASIVRIKNIILEHINASQSVYGTYSDNPRFKREYIMDEIVASDFDYAVAICLNPDHSERAVYAQAAVPITESPSGSKQGRIPVSTGEIDAPLITLSSGRVVTGKTAPSNWIDILNADAANLFGTAEIKEGLYWTGNGIIKWTGQSCSVVTYDVQHGTWSGAAGVETGTLRSPEQCESVIAAYTLSKLYAKQEDMMSASQFYAAIASQGFAAIASGELPIPKIEMYQQQRG